MFRTIVDCCRFRVVVSIVVERNAAPNRDGALVVTFFDFVSDFVDDGDDDGITDESSPSVLVLVETASKGSSSPPKIFDCFFLYEEEELELDFDSSFNRPNRPSSFE